MTTDVAFKFMNIAGSSKARNQKGDPQARNAKNSG